MNGIGTKPRTIRLTAKGHAACGYGRTVAADSSEQFDRLRAFGFTTRQAWALVSAGYGFIGGAS